MMSELKNELNTLSKERVFEELKKTLKDVNEQKESFIKLNNELKEEIRKTKKYNMFMLFLALGSLLVTVILGILPFIK